MTSKKPTRAPRPRTLTKRQRDAFIAKLSAGYTVTAAAQAAGFHRQRLYEFRHEDPTLAEEWDAAAAAGVDCIEDELRAAAEDGWLEREEVFDDAGKLLRRTERQRRDPRLLVRLREWRRPAVGVNVNVAAPLEIEGTRAVGWNDLLEIARATGQERLLGFLPAGEDVETIDAEAVEIDEHVAALPPASSEDALSPVPAPPESVSHPGAPEPLSLAEWADILRDHEQEPYR